MLLCFFILYLLRTAPILIELIEWMNTKRLSAAASNGTFRDFCPDGPNPFGLAQKLITIWVHSAAWPHMACCMFGRAVNYFDLFESHSHAWCGCHIFQIALNYSAVYLQINEIARLPDKTSRPHSAVNLLQISTWLLESEITCHSTVQGSPMEWIYCFVRPKITAIKTYKVLKCDIRQSSPESDANGDTLGHTGIDKNR